ncbi:hypothetical protein [Paracoccus ravus]|uniref:hypothetical protein n=1 Tax=Paracoccus ravus TaxID=2447760 RepID=UPI00106DFED4|nr:hypothetical protein [Paracoccus ravus]
MITRRAILREVALDGLGVDGDILILRFSSNGTRRRLSLAVLIEGATWIADALGLVDPLTAAEVEGRKPRSAKKGA